MSDPVVRLQGVGKRFGDFEALRGVDLEVAEREVVVIVGPSGSGKSTLCRTVNGLERHDAGTIEIDGVPLPLEGRALARVRSDVGVARCSRRWPPAR